MSEKCEQGQCPKCGGDDLDFGALEVEGEMIFYPFTCNACKTKGKEGYKVSYIETKEE